MVSRSVSPLCGSARGVGFQHCKVLPWTGCCRAYSTAQYCTVQYRHEADRALRSKQRKWVIPLSDIVRCFVETVDHICVVLRCAAFAIGRFAQCSCKVSKPVAARLRTVRLPPFSGRWRCSAVRSTVIGFPRCPFSGTGLLKCPKSTKIDPIVMLQGSRIEICPSLASSYPSYTWETSMRRARTGPGKRPQTRARFLFFPRKLTPDHITTLNSKILFVHKDMSPFFLKNPPLSEGPR